MVNCSFKEKLKSVWLWFIEDPKRIVRISVLSACSVIVLFQLTECFWKLRHPPITTHSHFDLNETMTYPALTFCRDPPYKAEIMQKYNLAYHPRFTSHWKKYPYETMELDQTFWEATYNQKEYFVQYALSGDPNSIQIDSSIHFNLGQCHTLKPKKATRGAWKHSGFSLMLRHTIKSIDESSSEIPPGWHLFIHEPSENFTENRMQTSGRVEYMYIDVGEEVEIKLTAQHFSMMANIDTKCSLNRAYSATKCGEMCRWKHITKSVGCSGPWMSEIDMKNCDSYDLMKSLIVNYQNVSENFDDQQCNCPEPCRSIIYSAFVVNRKEFIQPKPSSQLWIYYTSKMVTIAEERPGYDLSQFVADMGGSLGFLLGLSVLGLIGLLERVAVLLLGSFIPMNKATTPSNDPKNGNINNKTNNYDEKTEIIKIKSTPLFDTKMNKY